MSINSNMSLPYDEFLTNLRTNQTNLPYIEQAASANIQWIYDIVKICHNCILESNELPLTKLNALKSIRDLMQTLQPPCLSLVQVYVLPIVYEIAIEKPHDKGQTRGSSFFQPITKNMKIPNIQQTGIQFMVLCSEILAAGALVKPKRSFKNKELNQNSDYAEFFNKYKKYDIQSTPRTISEFKNFNPNFLNQGRQKHSTKLKSYKFNLFTEYFVIKIMGSVESDNNPLINTGVKSCKSISNDLDMRKILKFGDPYITSSLIDQLINNLRTLSNFMGKKNCISLLTDFVKWGDIQAIYRLCNDTILQQVARRLAQVNGSIGIVEGQNIYPQVKGQREGKRKFFGQYLKSIQIIAKCLINKPMQVQNKKIIQIYKYFKEQKFEFPQNLILKRIQSEFEQNLSKNKQRNSLLLAQIYTKHENSSHNCQQKSSAIGSIQNITKSIQQCLLQIITIPNNRDVVDNKMAKIMELKNKFQDQIDKIDQNTSIVSEDLDGILQNAQDIINTVQKLENLHKKYKQNIFNFNKYQKQYTQIVHIWKDQNQNQIEQYENVKNSLQKVNDLFKVKQIQINQLIVSQSKTSQSIIKDDSKLFDNKSASVLKQSKDSIFKQQLSNHKKSSVLSSKANDNNRFILQSNQPKQEYFLCVNSQQSLWNQKQRDKLIKNNIPVSQSNNYFKIPDSKIMKPQQVAYKKPRETTQSYEMQTDNNWKGATIKNNQVLKINSKGSNGGWITNEDIINEPELKPLDESYYSEVQNEQPKKQFKSCFGIDRDIINSGCWEDTNGQFFGTRYKQNDKVMLSSKFTHKTQHNEYMINRPKIMKLGDHQTQQLSNRVAQLRINNSRLREELRQKSVQQFRTFRSQQPSEQVFFKSGSRTFQKSDFQATSLCSSIQSKHLPLNQTLYSQYLQPITDRKFRKACLRDKSLLFKNNQIQIGVITKYCQQAAHLTLYLTPLAPITGLQHSIIGHPNLQHDTYSKECSETTGVNKQIKIFVQCKVRSIGFSIPVFQLSYQTAKGLQRLSLQLPLTFNKFIEFSEPNEKILSQYSNSSHVKFEVDSQTISSTLKESFPELVKIHEQVEKKIDIFAVSANFVGQIFQMLISKKGSRKIKLQAMFENQRFRPNAEYLLLTLKNLMNSS